ncbi:putative iron-regulated membrane protein [Wenyingzhuangia heitensis]|uniref:Iron-regulated membrane protein n=1 Tax=Wenyingzhuangia heitensis TaxID=1487859 RepID=A0ABX0UBK1_9FLAO|nr:PepSY-associated TM helix domain-containing protein [Wenyingzhuangia heitensis]NIJ44447.1 putative iron-regulated membrane protein [Wenyingzhuangia heitensis]
MIKIKKKIFYKIHSWIGIKLSVLFFIVCFSGTLATLSHEMDWLFNPEMRAIPQKEYASRNLIVNNFKKEYPEANIQYWMRSNEPYLCDIIYKKENNKISYVFANQYTGAIQGESSLTIQRFFRDLHYFLFIPFQVGNFLVLFFGFLLLISLITALCFYSKWWRKLFELQTKKGALVFFRSLHRLVGLWSIPFTLLFSITGIWYFLERANVAGIRKKANPRVGILEVTKKPSIKNLELSLDYDKAILLAKMEIPDLVPGNIYVPQDQDDILGIVGTSTEPLVRQRANRVYLNPSDYSIVYVQKAKDINTVMWINDIADPLHFGYWGGLVTKVIWFVFGLGISSLVLSGIWITLKRKAIRKKQLHKPVMGLWKYINWVVYGVLLSFMYVTLIQKYQALFKPLFIISLGWFIIIGLTYYIFVYRISKLVNRI